MLPVLPREISDILAKISAAGGQGYLVGGALRDLLLGSAPHDWDIAATLEPHELLAAFPGSMLIGGAMGTVKVPFAGGGCEITPCREEAQYADRRHPDKVVFGKNILEDLARRDFTVNAMAYTGEVLLDPFGGQQDLESGLLRCVGNVAERFVEDPLRVLRLYRFAATLGFTAEWNTFCAANDAAKDIATLPPERVMEEMRAILLSAAPQVLGQLIAKGGLARYEFAFAPSLAPLVEVPKVLSCRWWALMALCGADPAVVGEAFGFSRRSMALFEEYTRLYRLGPAANNLALKEKIRDIKFDYAPVAATFAAVSPSFVAEPEMFAGVKQRKEPYRVGDLAVSGDMLMDEGVHGKRLGRMLDELLGVVIKNPALNRTEVLLGLARGLGQLF